MPRRKQLKFSIHELNSSCYIIEELSQLPQLSNYDMASIELTIKENVPTPRIVQKEVGVLIDRLQRGYSANKNNLLVYDGIYIVNNTDLAKWMKVTVATVNRWLKNGIIRTNRHPTLLFEYFNVEDVIEQLRKQKQ